MSSTYQRNYGEAKAQLGGSKDLSKGNVFPEQKTRRAVVEVLDKLKEKREKIGNKKASIKNPKE